MLSIVTHGIIGSSYRKDVVVEGEMDASDFAVLCDLRSKLSFDSSGDAPQSGWLMQPAPSGMWLSRLELALDEQNRPAYVATSFLIPRGCQLRGDASLVLVIRTQMMNRHNYINERNIIMARPDWSFLKTFGQELESHLSPCSIVAYRKPFVGDAAYYPDTPASMLREMWNDNFSLFGTVFCGKGLLSPNADCPNVMEVDFAEQVSKQEEEMRRRREEEEARMRQEQEAQRRKEAEEAQMWKEEEARRRKEAEEARVKLEEEAQRRKKEEYARLMQEEEERHRREAEERTKLYEIPRINAVLYGPPTIDERNDESVNRKREAEEKERTRKEEARRRNEAEEAKVKLEEEARRRKEKEEMRSHITNSNPYGLIEEVDYNRHGVGLAVADVITTLLGGWLGIILSIILLGNVKVRGLKYHKYRKGERIVAIVCLILAPIIMLFWTFVFLAMLASVDEEYAVETSTYTANGVAFALNKVEGGTFMMGADGMDAEAKEWEKPAHWVTLSDYCIGETEVTQELWEAVMGKNSNISDFKGAKQPVERVSWEDCQEFLAKLNDMTGEEFRLPTEAEWEFAARGGIYSNQYKYSGSDDIDEVAWYFRNSGDKYIDWNSSKDTTNYLTEVNHCRPHPVKQKKPNELGLYDMTGNVLEWCSDWYDRYSAVGVTDPQGPESANPDKYGKVRRGGYYLQSEYYSRITYRINTRPNERHAWLGLRLALSVA